MDDLTVFLLHFNFISHLTLGNKQEVFLFKAWNKVSGVVQNNASPKSLLGCIILQGALHYFAPPPAK